VLLDMRLASLVASLGWIALVTLLVRRETASPGIGLVAGPTITLAWVGPAGFVAIYFGAG
jgi:hypothetical protein